ncbi:hypothetical protein N7507_005273 [Penicillium longicatenatum]|nr:hypothetical protein N7507_005273 [Penicillium longicatenatum]
MSSPPINLPSWQVAIGIFLSLTFIILIEKVFGIHVNVRFNKGASMAAFPGWAQILGPGETQAALLHRWIEAHRNPGQPAQSTPAPTPATAPTTAQSTQHLGYTGTFKSKQLMVDA